MEKDELPKYTPVDELGVSRRQARRRARKVFRTLFLTFLAYSAYSYFNPKPLDIRVRDGTPRTLSVTKLQQDYAQCAKLRSLPKDPSGPRDKNARWNGAEATLIRNTTVWTGEPVDGKFDWVKGDVLLEYGLIKRVAAHISKGELPEECKVHDGSGKLLTAGIIDMHSHTSVDTLPETRGGNDDNELSSDITPYVRSLDAINPLDPQIQVIKSGGVTTSLILPGSGNNIGGEAFVIKHAVGKTNGRPEISADDMLADPEKNWRYMKSACGENAKRVYGKVGRHFGPFSRMGEAWYFRHAYEQARSYKQSQDDWCAAADQFGAEEMQTYLPFELEWETLGAVLRGQVHVNTHCYTVPDLEAFIRLTNEFKFPVRAFHHAHQTYLVPEILKRAYGGRPPAAALFADNMYYKMESYIGSEQAGKILNENGITPVYVSDNPVLNAQHVVFEAAKAYRYGLPYYVALAGVTSASAELLGLGERIGKVKEGFDGDLALWDSDPLSVGATPVQVWIDGAPQFDEPVVLKKADAKPLEHAKEDVNIYAETPISYNDIVFTGVSAVVLPGHEQVLRAGGNVVIINGTISCVGPCGTEISTLTTAAHIELKDGHLVPPATAFGSFLGIEEISAESSTNDGGNNADSFSAGIKGLSLDTKSLQAAYRHGVARAISAPAFHHGGHKGSSVGFRINAKTKVEKHAIFKTVASVHYPLNLGAREGRTPSMSSVIGELETKLFKALDANETSLDTNVEQQDLSRVVRGELPLVVDVHKADVIAELLHLKSSIDKLIASRVAHLTVTAPKLRLVILGGAEAHILATELAAADIGVVLSPAFPYSVSWDQRRSLTGAPLTNGTAIDVLHAAGVKFALGTAEDWETRDLFLAAGIAKANSGGKIGVKEALALVAGNVYEILGIEELAGEWEREWVAFEGNPLEIRSQVRAVADGRGMVDVWA